MPASNVVARLAPLLLLCATACGDPRDDVPAAPKEALTAETFVPRVMDAVCDWSTRCTPSQAYLTCSGMAEGSDGSAEQLAASVAAGRASFDAAKAEACLASITGAACSSGFEGAVDEADCEATLVGRVALGGGCYDSEECAEGYCEEDNACPGTCRAYAREGESCAVPCGRGLHCDADSKCARSKANGEPCQDSQECTSHSCALDAQVPTCVAMGDPNGPPAGTGAIGAACGGEGAGCVSGAYCKQSMEGPGVCAAVIAAGAKCGEGNDFGGLQAGCGALACAGGRLEASSTGAAIVPGTCSAWSNLGARCTPPPAGALYAVSGCMLGLTCGSDGKCVTPPTAGPCLEDPFARCALTSYCDAQQTCQPKKAAGASCNGGEECATWCGEDGLCAPDMSGDACTP